MLERTENSNRKLAATALAIVPEPNVPAAIVKVAGGH